jgi:hypothetical protein
MKSILFVMSILFVQQIWASDACEPAKPENPKNPDGYVVNVSSAWSGAGQGVLSSREKPFVSDLNCEGGWQSENVFSVNCHTSDKTTRFNTMLTRTFNSDKTVNWTGLGSMTDDVKMDCNGRGKENPFPITCF